MFFCNFNLLLSSVWVNKKDIAAESIEYIARDFAQIIRSTNEICAGNIYKEAGVLRDTDFDARRLFQMYDPSGNVVEIYAYLRNVREEILMH